MTPTNANSCAPVGELSAIIGLEIVKLLCAGFHQQNLEATILVEFVTTDGESQPEVIDECLYPNINPFCAEMLGNPATQRLCHEWYTKQLENACLESDEQAREPMCHMKLRLVSIPLSVGGKTRGMLFTGIRQQAGTAAAIPARLRKLERDGVDVRRLETLVPQIPRAKPEEFSNLRNKLDSVARHILQLVDDKFRAEANLAGLSNLADIAQSFPTYCRDRNGIWQACLKALDHVRSFFGVAHAGVFIGLEDQPDLRCVAESPRGVFTSRKLVLSAKPKLWLSKHDPLADNETGKYVAWRDGDAGDKPAIKWLAPVKEEGAIRAVVALGSHGPPVLARSKWFRQACSELAKQIARLAMQVRLREADEQKEEFLREMAHQLKGPIQSIVNEGLYIAEKAVSRAQSDSRLEEAQETIRYETSVVKSRMSLLNFFTGTMGVTEYFLGNVGIGDLVRSSEKRYSLAAKRRSVSIVLEDSVDNLPDVVFDAKKLEIVFDNLIDNAVKYSHSDRTVEIRARVTRDYVIVSIEDFGWGIAPDELLRIFRMFERGTQRSKFRLVPGTGIGLNVSQTIMQAHGGEIRLSSVPQVPGTADQGRNYLTTATVIVPRWLKEGRLRVGQAV